MKKIILWSVLASFFILSCSKDDTDLEETLVEISVSATINTATEGSDNGQFTFTLSSTLNAATLINYEISGSATNGTDYQNLPNTITIPPNTSSQSINIITLEDGITEGNETVTVILISPNNTTAILGASNSATVTISESPEDFVLLPQEASAYMVNPNATSETIALFYNLKELSKTKFIVGQQDAFNSFYNDNDGISDIKKTTGSDPGLLGSDFMFITDDSNDGASSNWFYQQEQIIMSDAVEAYNKGMVNMFTWHMREPFAGEHFYTSQMTQFQKDNALMSILPGGENHDYYKLKLQKVAEVAQNMFGDDGTLTPFIFRPFHEFDGDWFWWGAAYCTPQQYRTLWQFTVDYLKGTLGVNNMLFAYSPDNNFLNDADYLSRYPGDAYVDILGMDNYGDFNNQGQMALENANEKLQILSHLSKEKVKIAALTESCFFVTPGQNMPIEGFYANNLYDALSNNEVEIGFMMFWSNKVDTYCTPTPELESAPDFLEFINKPRTVLENDLPDMYSLPL